MLRSTTSPSRYSRSAPSNVVWRYSSTLMSVLVLTALSLSLFARLGVRFVVHRHQVRERNLRVLLCRGETCVAQQLLNRPQIRAVGEQMGRVRVAQAVGMNRGVARDHARVKFNDVARAPVGQPLA